MKEIIKLENVKKVHSKGGGAVNDVSLCIKEKEQVLIYGTAGSGKSTLMCLIAGLEMPSSGKIFVIDKAVHEMKSDVASDFRNLNFGIIQRNPCFLKSMNLLENVAFPLTLRGIATSKRIQAAKQQLKALGLLYAAHAYPERISTYEAQLASLARALIAQPKVLLLDEITAGLSEKEGFQILGIIHDIGKLRDLVVISFSGTKDCIVSWDRYFTLDHGRIQEEIL